MPTMTAGSQLNHRSPQRTRFVWTAFVAAMTVVSGGLILGDSGAPHLITPASVVTFGSAPATSDITPREGSLDRSRWQGIVIHHSGSPAGDAETLDRQDVGRGLTGLGYHFVIGNGQGLGDGAVHVGYRWNRQLAGAHVADSRRVRADGITPTGLNQAQTDDFNRHSIGICLVGNGNKRQFSARQIRELLGLVRTLQREMSISADRVHLHSDLAPVASPGLHFPVAEFESQLLR